MHKAAVTAGVFLEMQFRRGNCFCGKRKCEKHPKKQTKVFIVWGENLKLRRGNFRKNSVQLTLHALITLRTSMKESLQMHFKIAVRNFAHS